MIEFIENFYILHELQIFKPICNIITSNNRFYGRNRTVFSPVKKRNIIRQWFQYIVWANRIKKVLLDKPCIELIDLEIISRRSHYDETLNNIKLNKDGLFKNDPTSYLKDTLGDKKLSKIAGSVVEEFELAKQKMKADAYRDFYHQFLKRTFINFRFQEITFGKPNLQK